MLQAAVERPVAGDARSSAPVRFPALNGLRAIAALLVLLTHVSINATGNRGRFAEYFARMDVGVSIFFVLSGFLLYRQFVAHRLAGEPGPGLGRYTRNRLLRIVPLYWLVLTVALFVYPGTKTYHLGDLLGFYTFTYVYRPHADFGPVVQAWSLCAEMAFYLLLPLYAALMARLPARHSRARYRNEILGVVALIAVAQLFRVWAVGLDNPADRLIKPTWFLNHLDTFGVGMLLAVLFTRWHERDQADRPRWVDSRWLPGAAWLFALGCFWTVSTRLGLPLRDLISSDSDEFARHASYIGIALGLVTPAVLGPLRQGLVRRFLSTPVMHWLGLFSYGIFLWQNVVISRYLERHRGLRFNLSLPRLLLWALVVTVILSAITYFLVERPVLARKRRPISGFATGMWAIGLVGLGWRLVTLLTINARNPDGGDPFYYHHQANLVANGQGFAEPFHWVVRHQLVPTAVHPPLMTTWLAISSLLGGRSWLAHKTMAALAGAAVVVMIGLVARELAGDRAGLFAAALAAVYPNLWIIDGTLWPEGLYSFLIASALFLSYRWLRRPSMGLALAFGLTVGLAALSRGEALLLLPLVVMPVILRARQVDGRTRLYQAAAATAVVVAVCIPWTVRNLSQFRDPVLLSTNSEEVIFYANCPDVYSGPMAGYWSFNCQQRIRAVRGDPPGDEAQRAKAWRRRGIAYARQHADRLPYVAVARVGRVWDLYRSDHNMAMMHIEGRPLRWSRVGQRFYWALLPFAAAGLIVLVRRRVPVLPMVAMFGLVTLTALTVYGGIRFRTPAEVALLVFAGVAVDAAVRAARHEVAAGKGLPPGSSPPATDPRQDPQVPRSDVAPADDRVPVAP